MSEENSGSSTQPAGSEPGSSAGATNDDVTRKAGRGGLAVAGAKVYFILTGLVQQIVMPWLLGLGGYGALGSALSIASITYNPIVTTSIQGVSRAVAQSPEREQPAAIRRTFLVHLVLALFFAGGFFLLAPLVARAVGAPHIVPALRILSSVLLIYGLYTPLVGVLNGRKQFLFQAGFDVLAATLRTGGLLAGAWWFHTQYEWGVRGAAAGFAAGACVVLAVAFFVVGIGKSGSGGPSVRDHLVFILPLLLGQTLLNLLLQADLTMLRWFASDAAEAAGLTLKAADPLVGAYRATQLYCFLPYQLLLAVTFILFPMLAKAAADGDRQAVARYVSTGVRLAVVLAGVMVSVTSGLSGPLIRLVFPAEAAELGTRSMHILTLGFGAFAVFGILTTVLNSLKRERASAAVTLLAFASVVVLCLVQVRGAPFGPDLLFKTALSTSAGLGVATLGAGILVKRTAGAVVPPLSVVRVAAGMTVAITIGRHLPQGGKPLTLVMAAVVALSYVAVLAALRELGRADVEMVRSVLRRKRRTE